METRTLLPRERKFLQDATRIVEDHLAEQHFNVNTFCRCIGKSRPTAHRLLKKTKDQSAGEFIRSLRLDHAVKLMLQGELNIRQAARMSGFFNPSYFSKCFRQQYGLNPSEYIRQTAAGTAWNA